MSVNLLHGRKTFIVQVPPLADKEIKDYLMRLTENIEKVYTQLVDNDTVVMSIINTATSGTFDDSAGGTVTVTDGLITGLA